MVGFRALKMGWLTVTLGLFGGHQVVLADEDADADADQMFSSAEPAYLADADQTSEIELLSDDLDSDPELSMTQQEIRQKKQIGASLHLGVNQIWQRAGMRGFVLHNEDVQFGFGAGMGSWELAGARAGKDYMINVDARTVYTEVQYFLTEMIPVYGRCALGFVFWQGQVKPRGTHITDDPESTELREKYRTSFHANGPFLVTAFGWQYGWRSGVFVDVALIGLGVSYVASKSLTTATESSKKALTEELQRTQAWGLMNLGVGILL